MAFLLFLNRFATKEHLRGTRFPLMFAGGLYRKIPDRQASQSAFEYAGPDRVIFNGHIIMPVTEYFGYFAP